MLNILVCFKKYICHLGVVSALLCSHVCFSDSPYQAAYDAYLLGEEAKAPAARREHFKHALTLYLPLLDTSPSPSLFYNLGNTYLQLEEYGYAILYYSRALALDPRNENLRSNLAIALEKAHISSENKSSLLHAFKQVFFYFSLFEYQTCFLILSSVLFLVFSLFIWLNRPLLKRLAYALCWFWVPNLIVLSYFHYFHAPQAIVLEASMLHRDAGAHYAHISPQALYPGSRVTLLLHKEKWAKIKDSSGQVGFLLQRKIEEL